MKIAFIVRRCDKRGGISRYVAELSEGLASDNEIHIFASSCQDISAGNISFHRIPMLSFSRLRTARKFALNNIFEIGSFRLNSYFRINYEEFDIVHAQGDYTGKSDVYTAHSCHKAWLKIAQENSSGQIEKLKKSSLNPLHHLILAGEKQNLMMAKKIIAVSSGVKREILKNYPVLEEKIVVIPNGVDIIKFSPENKSCWRNSVREKYHLAPDDFVAIFSAHEFKRKGLEYIIRAMKILNYQNMFLLVAGRDNPWPYQKLAGELEIKEKVIFAGEVNDIERYYAAADVFICPTLYESFLFAGIEAAAAGLPLLVTRVNGVEEYLVDGQNGFFIERDLDDIARKISLLYENKKLSREFSSVAREKAREYRWEKIVQQTRAIYEEVKRLKGR